MTGGHTPRASALPPTPSSSSSQASLTNPLIWASALLPPTPTPYCSQQERGTLQPPPTGQHNSKPHGTIPTGCQHLPRGVKAPLTIFNMPRRGFPFFHRSQPTIYQPLFPSRNCVASQVCLPFPTSLAVLTATHCMDTLPRLPSLRVLQNCWNGEFLVRRRSRLDTY